jgi:hypothetical protein
MAWTKAPGVPLKWQCQSFCVFLDGSLLYMQHSGIVERAQLNHVKRSHDYVVVDHRGEQRKCSGNSTEKSIINFSLKTFSLSPRTDQQSSNPNIPVGLRDGLHRPPFSASHTAVRPPAALRLVIARLPVFQFFHPFSLLNQISIPGRGHRDNFNRHSPIRRV